MINREKRKMFKIKKLNSLEKLQRTKILE